MSRHDVVIIGAGAAGLSAGALLAKEGKSVVIVEASQWLGGRGVAVPDEGFKINLGGHLVEDSGSGITKVFEHVGKELIHGATSSDMVIWDHEKSRWGSIREQYSADKSELKKLIQIVVETPYEEFDEWDDRTLREWMLQHTTARGRDRAVGVHHRARGDHRELVGPLGLGQPLHAQDALLREGHRRLLVLAGPGLGRDVQRPSRRGRRERRRGSH